MRKHENETGLFVYGWFNRLRGWDPPAPWAAVSVFVDGEHSAVVQQLDRGPHWIALDAGTHQVELKGSGRLLHSERVKLQSSQMWLLAFKPSEKLPWQRTASDPSWYSVDVKDL